MLWASYRSAHNRKVLYVIISTSCQSFINCHLCQEMEVALERLTAYIKVWVERGAGSVSSSPMISAKSDRFGLLRPCIA